MVDLYQQAESILRKDSSIHDGNLGEIGLVNLSLPLNEEMLIGSVASVKTLEDVKSDPHCLYIAMPVQVRLSHSKSGTLINSNSKP